MIITANSHILGNAFLREVIVTSVDAEEFAAAFDDELITTAVTACRASGSPLVIDKPDSDSLAAVVCLPVYFGATLRSIITFVIRQSLPIPPGVVEIWSPMGEYQDLTLREGYFANLDRFHNVSTFVQFEKGAGLPGQAWATGRAIIHDQLAEHPGFVRAAGASADALQTAIGIPIFSDQFIATCVMISSRTTPLARAMEVWTPTGDDDFELTACAYSQSNESLKLSCGARLTSDAGLIGMAADSGGAVASQECDLLHAGRELGNHADAFQGAVAIPTFVENRLTCITMIVL